MHDDETVDIRQHAQSKQCAVLQRSARDEVHDADEIVVVRRAALERRDVKSRERNIAAYTEYEQ